MNPIDELRAARPAHLGDGPVDEETRRAELAHAMAQGRPARRRRNLRPVWGLSLAGAAAAVTAFAVLTAGTGGGTAPRAPSQALTQPEAGETVKLSAQEVLLVAATRAEREPATTGRFWHTESVDRMLFVASAGYVMAQEQRIRTWVTAGEQWSEMRTLAAEPATDEDRARWEAAGSPKEVEIPVPGKKGGMRLVTTEAGKPHTGHHKSRYAYWLGRNVTLADLASLPEDEAGLKAWLLEHYEGKDTEGDRPMGEDAWLFRVSAGLITDMPVSAKVRGAAFRMLAALPSVTSVGTVTDSQGRKGTAVSIDTDVKVNNADTSRGVVRDRLIIDEESGRALGRESVVVRPGGLWAGLAPGTVSSSSAVVEAGWSDTRER
ncbi:CU044_5270 family protein [Nonomuraea dietziae]|uniref:CU044_5270 family protein n=1 Tax=Nonomuraea dietziae TaxID=65515 RepID=UPI0033E34DEF